MLHRDRRRPGRAGDRCVARHAVRVSGRPSPKRVEREAVTAAQGDRVVGPHGALPRVERTAVRIRCLERAARPAQRVGHFLAGCEGAPG